MGIKVKYRDDETIRRAADEFRNSVELRGFDLPPIDVIYIAEIILKLNVIVLPDRSNPATANVVCCDVVPRR